MSPFSVAERIKGMMISEKRDELAVPMRIERPAIERFSIVFEREYPALLRFAYFLIADRAAAEDLVQEAFLRTFRIEHRVDDAGIARYVRKVILNLSKSAARRRAISLHRDTGVTQNEDDPGQRIVDSDVRRALLTLPLGQRACLACRFYEDMTEREIARTLGMSLPAVKKRIQRALQRLRPILEEEAGT